MDRCSLNGSTNRGHVDPSAGINRQKRGRRQKKKVCRAERGVWVSGSRRERENAGGPDARTHALHHEVLEVQLLLPSLHHLHRASARHQLSASAVLWMSVSSGEALRSAAASAGGAAAFLTASPPAPGVEEAAG